LTSIGSASLKRFLCLWYFSAPLIETLSVDLDDATLHIEDLFKSILKSNRGEKKSGNIIQRNGGIVDQFYSGPKANPVVWLVFSIFRGKISR
jgi:CDP-diglyceride synthetase